MPVTFGEKTMTKASTPYHQVMSNYYQDDDYVAALLNECLEQGDPEALLIAIREVAKVRKLNISEMALALGLGSSGVYKALSKNGNPRLRTFLGILSQLGCRLKVEALPKVA